MLWSESIALWRRWSHKACPYPRCWRSVRIAGTRSTHIILTSLYDSYFLRLRPNYLSQQPVIASKLKTKHTTPEQNTRQLTQRKTLRKAPWVKTISSNHSDVFRRQIQLVLVTTAAALWCRLQSKPIPPNFVIEYKLFCGNAAFCLLWRRMLPIACRVILYTSLEIWFRSLVVGFSYRASYQII